MMSPASLTSRAGQGARAAGFAPRVSYQSQGGPLTLPRKASAPLKVSGVHVCLVFFTFSYSPPTASFLNSLHFIPFLSESEVGARGALLARLTLSTGRTGWGVYYTELCRADVAWPSPRTVALRPGAQVRLATLPQGSSSGRVGAALDASAVSVLAGRARGVVVAVSGGTGSGAEAAAGGSAPAPPPLPLPRGLEFLLGVRGAEHTASVEIVCAFEEALALLQRAQSEEEAMRCGRVPAPLQPTAASTPMELQTSFYLADAVPSLQTASLSAQRGECGISPFAPPADLFYSAVAACERAAGGAAERPLPGHLRCSTLGPIFLLIAACCSAAPPTRHARAYATVLLRHLESLLAPVPVQPAAEGVAAGGCAAACGGGGGGARIVAVAASAAPSGADAAALLSLRRHSRRAGWLLEILSLEGVSALSSALLLEELGSSREDAAVAAAARSVIRAACSDATTLRACAGWSRLWEAEAAPPEALVYSSSGLRLPALGDRVVRGPSWKWDDQDGGAGCQGVVLDESSAGWWRVRWDHGGANGYRCDPKKNIYDLCVLLNAEVAAPAFVPRTWLFTTGVQCTGSANFMAASGDILFHFNPRPAARQIVMNTLQNGSWGEEERIPLPMQRSGEPMPLHAEVRVDSAGFHVNLGGVEAYMYRHRSPFSRLTHLQVDESWVQRTEVVQEARGGTGGGVKAAIAQRASLPMHPPMHPSPNLTFARAQPHTSARLHRAFELMNRLWGLASSAAPSLSPETRSAARDLALLYSGTTAPLSDLAALYPLDKLCEAGAGPGQGLRLVRATWGAPRLPEPLPATAEAGLNMLEALRQEGGRGDTSTAAAATAAELAFLVVPRDWQSASFRPRPWVRPEAAGAAAAGGGGGAVGGGGRAALAALQSSRYRTDEEALAAAIAESLKAPEESTAVMATKDPAALGAAASASPAAATAGEALLFYSEEQVPLLQESAATLAGLEGGAVLPLALQRLRCALGETIPTDSEKTPAAPPRAVTAAPAHAAPLSAAAQLHSPLQRVTYHALPSVPFAGSRVRRGPGLQHEQVASIERRVFVGTGEVRNSWAKVHACMEEELRGSFNFHPFDIAREGWVALQLENTVYYRTAL